MSLLIEDTRENESRLRTMRTHVETHSKTISNIVDTLVVKYSKDLDKFVRWVKDQLTKRDKLSDDDIEQMCLKIPVFMYFTTNGLEDLGIEGDMAKAKRKEVFSEAFEKAVGTIPDKQAAAELSSMYDTLIEIAYARAYKKLRHKIDMADHIFSGAKKIISKRMTEFDLSKRELNYQKGERESNAD